MEKHDILVQSLMDPSIYDHPVDEFQLRETHISSVILTGPYAYKIKKPVKFDFLDFSNLSKRKTYCKEEIRLNSRLCPELYCETVTISGSVENPRLGKEGSPIDYAVKIVQFPENQLFSTLAKNKMLSPEQMDELTDQIVEFHQQVKPETTPDYASAQNIKEIVMTNLDEINELNLSKKSTKVYREIRDWIQNELNLLKNIIEERRRKKFVRHCHGDMHLNNIVLFDGSARIFDCIEYNEKFRWIDVIDEVSFLAMDLDYRSLPELSNRLLNRYITLTGDHAGVQVLDFYRVHRALVRFKVNKLDDENNLEKNKQNHLKLAHTYLEDNFQGLIITHGYSGAGKTTFTQEILEKFGAIRIRSDVERKRMAGVPFTQTPDKQLNEKLYSVAMTNLTYNMLAERADKVLQANFPVIIDATFLKQEPRQKFLKLARKHQVPFGILDFKIDDSILEKRLDERSKESSVSDADISVLKQQKKVSEPLQDYEKKNLFKVSDSSDAELMQRIRNLLTRNSENN